MDTRVAGFTVNEVDPVTLPDVAVTVVVPAATEVAKPLEPAALLTVATPVLDELQVAEAVRSCVVLSENVPVAENCVVVPLAMLGLEGVTVMDTRVAGFTVSEVDPVTLPDAAVIVVVPAATEVARPLEPAALLTAATPVLDELQVAEAVRSCVVLSENVPVAENCLVVPLAMLGLEGVTVMDTRVAGFTVSEVDPVTLPDVAVTVVVPAATDVARPLEPAALLTAATPVLDELQVAEAVRSCVVLSENVPVAANCVVVPLAMLELVGVTVMDTRVALSTVSEVDPVTLPDVAVTVVVPAATEVARPLEPAALLTVATPVLDELQVAKAVRSCVVLSENVPVAANCVVVPVAMLGSVGVTAMDARVALVTVIGTLLEVFPNVALTLAWPAFNPYAYACPLPFCDSFTIAVFAEVAATSLNITTDESDEVQVTKAVRSSFELSE